jgi:hypothetical protein
MAAKLLAKAENQHKSVTAGNIADDTILQMKSGRRSTGNSNAEVSGICCTIEWQINHHQFR